MNYFYVKKNKMRIYIRIIGVVLLIFATSSVLGQTYSSNKEFIIDTTLNRRIKQYGQWDKRLNHSRRKCATTLSRTKDTLKIKLLFGDGLTGSFVNIYISKYNNIPIVTYNTWTDCAENEEYTTFANISIFSIKLNKNPFKDGFIGLLGEFEVNGRNGVFEFVVNPTQEDDIPINYGKEESFSGHIYSKDSMPLIGAFIFGFWKDDYCIEQSNSDIDAYFYIRKDSIKYFQVYMLNYETYTFSYGDVKDYNDSFRRRNRGRRYYNIFLNKRRYNCPELLIYKNDLIIDSVLYKTNFPDVPSRSNVRFSSMEDSYSDPTKLYTLANPVIGYTLFYRELSQCPEIQNMIKGDWFDILFTINKKGDFIFESIEGYNISSDIIKYLSDISSWHVARNLSKRYSSKYRMHIEKR